MEPIFLTRSAFGRDLKPVMTVWDPAAEWCLTIESITELAGRRICSGYVSDLTGEEATAAGRMPKATFTVAPGVPVTIQTDHLAPQCRVCGAKCTWETDDARMPVLEHFDGPGDGHAPILLTADDVSFHPELVPWLTA